MKSLVSAGFLALALTAGSVLPLMGTGASAARAEEAATVVEPENAARDDIIGDLAIHYVRKGDNLIDLAIRYGIGFVELRAANPDVDPWLPKPGTVLMLPERHIVPADAGPGILVNLGDLRLYLIPPEGSKTSIMSWPISSGREAYETPLGLYSVVQLTKNPTWVPTAEHRKDDPTVPNAVGPGPDNPLGDRRIRVGWNGYAIHGTNKPEGVGLRVSRGCVRMYPQDVRDLFDMVKVGTPVTITNQPVKFGWHEGELYIEVHPVNEEVDQIEWNQELVLQPIGNIDELVFEAAGKDIGRVNWNSVYVAAEERRGIPVQITR